MSYDEQLEARIVRALGPQKGISQKRMFGGMTFMLGARMFCGVVKDELMVRVGPARFEKALAKPGALPMDFTGRPMKGFVYVAPEGLRSMSQLRGWLRLGVNFVSSLDAGESKPKKRPPKKRAGGR